MAEVFGIDVSHHNGKIAWDQVAKHKKFVIMKAQYEAQSHRIDETFEYNYKEAGRYGLSRGVYIYIARASVSDPIADANALLSKLKGRILEYGIWLDLEDKRVKHLSKAQWNNIIYTYTNLFREAGYFVGIYCNMDWYNNVLDSKNLKDDFEFWIARYPKDDRGIYKANSPLKPTTYASAWQYSSKGSVPGIKNYCDLNVDFDGIITLMNRGGPKVVTMKTNREIAIEVLNGKWGTKYTKPSREELLKAAGYNPKEVQTIVNQLIKTGHNWNF